MPKSSAGFHRSGRAGADFGGWRAAQKVHVDDGGVFDQIYAPNAKSALR